jgi:hypothetical protein
MILSVILVKILISILVVLGLSMVAQRSSPAISGILSGYPLGSAITLFFYGFDMGANFASNSSVYSLLSLISCQVFVYVYYLTILRAKRFSPLICSFFSITAFFTTTYIFSKIEFSLYETLTAALISIIIFSHLFRKLPDVKIVKKRKSSLNVVLLRAIMSAIIVVIITSIPHFLGAKWAGLFSGFPIILLPLILIIHISYQKEHVCSVIKGFPKGLGSLIIYIISVHSFYPLVGIYLGTLLAFGFATIYLFSILLIGKRLEEKIAVRF